MISFLRSLSLSRFLFGGCNNRGEKRRKTCRRKWEKGRGWEEGVEDGDALGGALDALETNNLERLDPASRLVWSSRLALSPSFP